MADIDEWHAIVSDPVTMRFWPAPLTREQAAEWINRSLTRYETEGFGRNALVWKENGAIIGDVGVVKTTLDSEEVYDLGYIVHHSYQRRGIAVEAGCAMRDYAFASLPLPALHANFPHDHDASRRVAEKLGMTFVRSFDNPRNRDISTLIYRITAP